MQRIYLDANVFIAYIKSDMGKPFRMMYRDAEEFFKQRSAKDIIILSDLAFKEIKGASFYSKDSVLDFFRNLGIKIELVYTEKIETKNILNLCRIGMHRSDATHAALAISAKCDVLLTFNKKDFEAVGKKIQIKEPKELTIQAGKSPGALTVN